MTNYINFYVKINYMSVKCTYEHCTEKHVAKGFCRKHYDKFIRPKRTNYKPEVKDWIEINRLATLQFEEWKKTAIPFKVDEGITAKN